MSTLNELVNQFNVKSAELAGLVEAMADLHRGDKNLPRVQFTNGMVLFAGCQPGVIAQVKSKVAPTAQIVG